MQIAYAGRFPSSLCVALWLTTGMKNVASLEDVLYLPTLTPEGWKLRSHVGSRLRANFSRLIEKCELLPACLTHFQKYVNSDLCKERKPCVKRINDSTFLGISDFWSEKHWERARVYTRPETGTSKCEGCFRFRHRRTSSEDFGILRKYSEMIVSFSKIPALQG